MCPHIDATGRAHGSRRHALQRNDRRGAAPPSPAVLAGRVRVGFCGCTSPRTAGGWRFVAGGGVATLGGRTPSCGIEAD